MILLFYRCILNIYIYVDIDMSVCMYVGMSVCLSVCMHARMYVGM